MPALASATPQRTSVEPMPASFRETIGARKAFGLKVAKRFSVAIGNTCGRQRRTTKRCSRCSSSGRLDEIVDIQIVLARMVPGIVVPHAVDHQLTEILGEMIPHSDRPLKRGLQALPVVVVKPVTISLVVRSVRV